MESNPHPESILQQESNMNLTRGIAVSALVLAIALIIGAIRPVEPFARANPDPIIIIATPALAVPLATPLPAPVVEQPPAAPVVEQLVVEQQAAPVVEQLVVEQQAAPVVEQQAAPVVEQLVAAPVEQPAAPDQSMIPGTPEYNQALADIYNSLPVLVFSNDPPAPEQPITERQRQLSRQRTR